MAGRGLDYWRRYFRSEATSDILEIIECGIMVAAADCPNEFRLRRGRIAELLFSCQSTRCLGCDHVQLCVPVCENDDDGGRSGGHTKTTVHDNHRVSNFSYGDAEALTDEIEEESQLVGEVMRIKEILTNTQDESESTIYESLRRLQFLALTLEIIKSTEIGKVVNGLRKHSSGDVSHLAKLLIRVWKEMADEWVKATEQLAEAKNEGTPDSINPSVLDEEEGLPSPPMDEGAFFATPQTMELSQFFDGMDDDGNLRNSGEFSKNRESGRRPSSDNQNSIMRKPHPTNNANVVRKEYSNVQEHKNRVTVSKPNKPSIAQSGPGRPQKANAEAQASSLVKHRQALDKAPAQRKPLSGQHDAIFSEANLEATKKRLQERYQEAENAKKQRTIQVLDIIPKQGVSQPKKAQGRTGNPNRHRLLGRR
uniref:TFIIS N-terminal domain-containing protein n=1 Tax=Kalanchoe fedtschenkoi TaxID=63787 RepID=A0A7N0TIY1_KALFE